MEESGNDGKGTADALNKEAVVDVQQPGHQQPTTQGTRTRSGSQNQVPQRMITVNQASVQFNQTTVSHVDVYMNEAHQEKYTEQEAI